MRNGRSHRFHIGHIKSRVESCISLTQTAWGGRSMRLGFTRSQIAIAVSAALGTAVVSTANADRDHDRGTYVAGDIHNHTTCSDGSISMQKLVKKSTDTRDTPWGLD